MKGAEPLQDVALTGFPDPWDAGMTGPNEDWCSRQRSRSRRDRYRRDSARVRMETTGRASQTVRTREVVMDPGHLTAIVLATKARSRWTPSSLLSVVDEASNAIRREHKYYRYLKLCHLQTSCPQDQYRPTASSA
jgi:hypothetical protein